LRLTRSEVYPTPIDALIMSLNILGNKQKKRRERKIKDKRTAGLARFALAKGENAKKFKRKIPRYIIYSILLPRSFRVARQELQKFSQNTRAKRFPCGLKLHLTTVLVACQQ